MSKTKTPDYFNDFSEFTDDSESDVGSNANADDFASLLGESLKKRTKKVSVGDKIHGEILVLGKEDVFVSIDSTKEGILSRRELLNEAGECPYKVGDLIDCYVSQVRSDEVRLSKKQNQTQTADDLQDALQMQLPIPGRIVEVCKGGVRVNIKGKLAFCPISQIDIRHVEDPIEYVGKSFDFRVTLIAEGGRNIVVSRKKLLQEQSDSGLVSFLEEHPDGSIVSGRVSRLEKFGAFVELCPGVDGLVHISEIAWSRTADPADVLVVGQDVSVKLLKREVFEGKTKVSLSIKQVTPKEESEMAPVQRPEFDKYAVGTLIAGKVLRKEVYGVFIEIEPGLSGLLHKSKLIDHPSFHFEKMRVGDIVNAQIAEIKASERKISLGLPNDEGAEDWRNHQPASTQSLGTFADIMKNSKKTRD